MASLVQLNWMSRIKITLSVDEEVLKRFKELEEYYRSEIGQIITVKKFGVSSVFQHLVNKSYDDLETKIKNSKKGKNKNVK